MLPRSAVQARLRLSIAITLVGVGLLTRPIGLVANDEQGDSFVSVSGFVERYCVACHEGTGAEGELDLARFDSIEKITAERQLWKQVLRRVDQHEMPPADSELPTDAERQAFIEGIDSTLQADCSGGIRPGPSLARRLNRTEYGATLRDLLGIHINAAQDLPADGAGGEGFDNAAETLFISPIHGEKYLEAAHTAVRYAFADTRSRQRFLTAEPQEGLSSEDAARQVLLDFLPRAFRRPVSDDEVADYLGLFRQVYEQDASFDEAMQFALVAALVSPNFLFLIEQPGTDAAPELLNDFELASRLSYFLWASAPDEELFELAAAGKLNDPAVLTEQVDRMLGGGTDAEQEGRRRRRGPLRVREFAQSFIEQWLGTRALGREFRPDPSVGSFDSELEGGMKYEPVFFFEEILTQNRSLLELLDSDYTYANRRLARHYGIRGSFREQPRRTELSAEDHRGGLLGMASVLAVSSYPHRTSPVLRGKWILETLLGDPPPPPPPNVPLLDEQQVAASPKSLRERLEQHRANPTCANCHDRIDPLGFGLENYDVLGGWREEHAGQPIDTRGRLPDGTEFNGAQELKQILLDRKQQFIRHLTTKMLGYALARGLTNDDDCTIDRIVEQLEATDYSSRTLVLGIVRSVPFRYKAGTDPTATVAPEAYVGD